MKILGTILFTVFIFRLSFGQEAEKIILSGNDFYKAQQYEEATAQYKRAIVKDTSNTIALFNLGNSFYKKNSKDEAIKAYTDIVTKTKNKGLRSDSYYNTGVVLGKQQKLIESIEAYKNALRQNPENTDARENLQKALSELKKTPPRQRKNLKRKNRIKKKRNNSNQK